jgi:hypothetical protein
VENSAERYVWKMNLWASWQDLKVAKQQVQPPLKGQDKGQFWGKSL